MSQFGSKIDQAIMIHAASQPDQEICGLVRAGAKNAFYQPCQNSAADPRREFKIDLLDDGYDDTVLAVVHSHPFGPAYPSKLDMAQQIASRLPWGIAVLQPHEDEGVFWFGGKPADLMTRPFRHGVTDCYGLVRDWYALHRGLVLIDRPRQWDWWNDGEDFYAANFAKAGFTMLAEDAPLKIGDVGFASILSPVINHAVIWLGDGLILHHLAGRNGFDPSRLPRREPVNRWWRYIQSWVRYAA